MSSLSKIKEALRSHFTETIVLATLSFAYNIVITSYFDPSDFIKYGLFVAKYSLIYSIVEGGVGGTIIRYRIKDNTVFSTIQILFVFFIILIGLIDSLLSDSFDSNINYLLYTSVLVGIIATMKTSICLANLEFDRYRNAKIFGLIFAIFSVTILIRFIDFWGIYFFFLARSLGENWFLRGIFTFERRVRLDNELLELLKYGRSVSLVGSLNSYGLFCLKTGLSEINNNGNYLATWDRLQTIIGAVFQQIGSLASKILFPFLSRSENKSVFLSLELYMYATLISLLVLPPILPWLQQVLGLVKYSNYEEVLYYFLVWIFVDLSYSGFAARYKANGNLKGLWFISISKFVLIYFWINGLIDIELLVSILVIFPLLMMYIMYRGSGKNKLDKKLLPAFALTSLYLFLRISWLGLAGFLLVLYGLYKVYQGRFRKIRD